MPVLGAFGRSAAFALLFLVSVYAGRLTVTDGNALSLVWPAAGVAAVWFASQRRAGTFWFDASALVAITWIVNVHTGASGALATAFAVANLLQVGIFVWSLARFAPHLWGAGGDQPLSRTSDLWRLLMAAALSTACGAAVGPTTVFLLTGQYSWASTAVWLSRNTVSVVVISAVGLRIGQLIARRRAYGVDGWLRAGRRGLNRWVVRGRFAELIAVVACSAMAYTVTFGLRDELPIAFPLVVITVWVALRFNTTVVVLHDLAMGTVAVLLTLEGHGPFAAIESDTTRALVVQLFVGVVAIVGLAVALGRDERDLLLRQVRAAQADADERARLFRTVVNSMAEGLAVIDHDHRYLLRNPAAEELIGSLDRITDENGRSLMADSSKYGLFHADGRALVDGEQPYVRALAGEEVRNFDLVIRNESRPEGRTVSVNATPLQTPDGLAAVVVFSDVTAERRHRDELASFAGVVAHDLLNPLTTIEGWTELMQDRVGRQDGSPAAGSSKANQAAVRDGLDRVGRAAARMRNLILDLLAYTTSRDGRLQPVDLSLHSVLGEIVAARRDALAGDAASAPRFTYGDLHPVRADPALVRQLLDNLIGNAIKYAGDGPADITVESSQADGYVTVDVADRGIGVPADQRESIFEPFHRAHADGKQHGTGLGLSICRRIVERHDGKIWAEENPGGGTRVRFTLPCAEVHLPEQAGDRVRDSEVSAAP